MLTSSNKIQLQLDLQREVNVMKLIASLRVNGNIKWKCQPPKLVSEQISIDILLEYIFFNVRLMEDIHN